MRYCVSIFLTFLYAAQAILGHAGLHAVLSGHDHAHAPHQTLAFKSLENQNTHTVAVVTCFHVPGDDSVCQHQHHCHHHETDSTPAQEPVVPSDHDQEDCQLCHHLAYAALEYPPVMTVTMDFVSPYGIELTAEIYACYVAAAFAPRGPPAV